VLVTTVFCIAVAYHELDEGADDVDGVGGEEGVGEEAAEEREQERRAHEVGHRRRRLRRRVVHEPHQVPHQVARVRQERQVLQHLHHCNHARFRSAKKFQRAPLWAWPTVCTKQTQLEIWNTMKFPSGNYKLQFSKKKIQTTPVL